jgi:hypothetical protein
MYSCQSQVWIKSGGQLKSKSKKIHQMNKSNKNKRSQKQMKNNETLLSKAINVNSSIVRTSCLYTSPCYYYNGTQNYSFNNGADTRALSFLSILSTNTYPFNSYASIYDEFKIVSAYAVVTPYTGIISTVLPPLHLTCDPDGPNSNPTNLTVVNSANGHLFNPNAIVPRSVNVLFNGTSQTVGIWTDTAHISSIGAFYIGSLSPIAGVATTTVFEFCFKLEVVFRGLKGR